MPASGNSANPDPALLSRSCINNVWSLILASSPMNQLEFRSLAPRRCSTNLYQHCLLYTSWVLAIGSPFGLSKTVSAGIVSAKDRSIDDPDPNGRLKQFQRFIQTDAAINPGNSGGPLLDSSGSVIGINTAIIGPSGANVGIGFALPINRAKEMIEAYQSGKRYGQATLGVETVFVQGDLAVELGLPETGGLLILSLIHI